MTTGVFICFMFQWIALYVFMIATRVRIKELEKFVLNVEEELVVHVMKQIADLKNQSND